MTLAKKAALELYEAGRYAEAERRFKEAINEAVAGFGKDDPHVASCKNNLAEFYRNIGRYDDAEALYKEALDQLHDYYGARHWLYVSALHNLAVLNVSRGDLDRAQQALRDVLALRKQLFGGTHFAYADTMFMLANVMRRAGEDAKKFVPMMQQAITIVEDSGNTTGTPVLQWLLELSEVQTAQRQFAGAAASLHKALQHFKEQQGEEMALASEVGEKLADALASQGDLLAARAALDACVRAREQLWGRHLVVAKTWTKQAKLLLQQPRQSDAAQEAERLLQQAVALAQSLRAAPVSQTWWQRLAGSAPPLDKCTDRLRAAYQEAAALKLLAAVQLEAKNTAAGLDSAEAAVTVLQAAVAEAHDDLERASTSAAKEQLLEKLLGVYVDAQLLLIDCLEHLAVVSQQHGGLPEGSPRLQALHTAAEQVAQGLAW